MFVRFSSSSWRLYLLQYLLDSLNIFIIYCIIQVWTLLSLLNIIKIYSTSHQHGCFVSFCFFILDLICLKIASYVFSPPLSSFAQSVNLTQCLLKSSLYPNVVISVWNWSSSAKWWSLFGHFGDASFAIILAIFSQHSFSCTVCKLILVLFQIGGLLHTFFVQSASWSHLYKMIVHIIC